MVERDIIIVGGGLAGLTLAMDLSRYDYNLALIEKGTFPSHKVCGEYISNEVLPYLKELGIDPYAAGAVAIHNLNLLDEKGNSLKTRLPLGGFGLSRYTLDNLFYEKLKDSNCELRQDKVVAVHYVKDHFVVECQSGKTYQSKFVIGAYGKRSNLDISLSRNFIKKRSQWLAVKAHYKGTWSSDTVGLFTFKGGYCGVSKIEDGKVNVCYLVSLPIFQSYKGFADFEEHVLRANTILNDFYTHSEMIFDKRLSISQISFERKSLIKDHIIMCGDSAALIHPLCGNGMAMAIMSAKILTTCFNAYFDSGEKNRDVLENAYIEHWKRHFSTRISTGAILQKGIQNKQLTHHAVRALKLMPGLLLKIIAKTHGKPSMYEA